MKTILFSAFAILFSFSVCAQVPEKFDYSGLGKKIELKKDGVGKYSLGVMFSIDNDKRNESVWRIMLNQKTPFPKGTKWNLFLKDKKDYAFTDWREGFQGDALMAKLSGLEAWVVAAHPSDLVLVAKLPSGELSHLPIGDMCAEPEFKSYFKNIDDSDWPGCVETPKAESQESQPHSQRRGGGH